MNDKKQKNSHIYWNPYFGGFLLGIIIIFTFLLTKRGLGASGAVKSSVVTIVDKIAPTHAENNAYYSKFLKEDDTPMNTWLVFEALGVLMGRHERVEEAIVLMDDLLKLDPDSIMAHTNKSLYLMKLGQMRQQLQEPSLQV